MLLLSSAALMHLDHGTANDDSCNATIHEAKTKKVRAVRVWVAPWPHTGYKTG